MSPPDLPWDAWDICSQPLVLQSAPPQMLQVRHGWLLASKCANHLVTGLAVSVRQVPLSLVLLEQEQVLQLVLRVVQELRPQAQDWVASAAPARRVFSEREYSGLQKRVLQLEWTEWGTSLQAYVRKSSELEPQAWMVPSVVRRSIAA